jgi:hypothetical protein
VPGAHQEGDVNNAIASQDINILIQTADFAVKYGFLAIGLLLIFLIAPAIYRFSQAKLLSLVAVSFGLAFVIAFGTMDLASRILRDRTLLTGTVLGMTNGLQVQVRSDIRQAGQAYTKREVDPENGSVFNFPFILATQDTPGCLVVSIASTSSEKIFAFNIAPLKPEDMRSDTQVVVQVVPGAGDTMGLNVWREQGQKRLGEVIALEPLPETAQDCSKAGGAVSAFWSGLVGAAFAQDGVPADLANRLMSDDAFTRRDARIELSGQGAAAFPTIEGLLASGTPRLQAGGLVALGGMPTDEVCGAPDALWAAVEALSGTGDASVQEAAGQALSARSGC